MPEGHMLIKRTEVDLKKIICEQTVGNFFPAYLQTNLFTKLFTNQVADQIK